MVFEKAWNPIENMAGGYLEVSTPNGGVYV
jgi:hypothetical protein